MNLCIDIGNTNTKAGIFEGDDLLEERIISPERKIISLIKELKPGNVIIGSVKKGIRKIIQKSSRFTNLVVLDHTLPLPIILDYTTPHTLGVDRIAAVAGAYYLKAGKDCLVIDIGTCITCDFIDKKGVYHGGSIAPGVDMRLRAMHKFTSGLPLVRAKEQPDLIGKTTKECMLSGAVNGTIAEINGIIDRYQQFLKDPNIIICGGGAIFFETKLKGHIFAIPNLVLYGLNRILRYNLND